MRKFWILGFAFMMIFLSGCDNQKADLGKESVVDDKFIVSSIEWGSSWESVKDKPELSGYVVVADDGNRFAVETADFEFLGQKGNLRLLFSVSEEGYPESGFVEAYFGYDTAAKDAIIKAGEKIYGKRQSFFSDENGVENPLDLPAWYSEETLGETLTEAEKGEYLKKFEVKEYDESRIAALLRLPLVTISVDEENNVIKFRGSNAAIANNLKNQ